MPDPLCVELCVEASGVTENITFAHDDAMAANIRPSVLTGVLRVMDMSLALCVLKNET